MSIYYFGKNQGADKTFHTKDYWIKQMQGKTITVIEAEMVKNSPFFNCTTLNKTGETKKTCGVQCRSFEPRNGMHGRCRYHANTYIPSTKEKTFKIK